MPFLWMRYLPSLVQIRYPRPGMPGARHTSATATDTWHDRAGGRRGEADAADEASRPLLHAVRN